ncbi:serine protease [Tulasnella sp. 330]|nr:serine protease [Tulasnella sp. 330]KAG8876150.1 serine protease [Tulasnella sp. 332]KAG8877183.1 serine protease [Tulasnella sp. 331]
MFSQLVGVSLLAVQVYATPLSTYTGSSGSNANQQISIAPLLLSTVPDTHIPNSYIIVLKDGADLTSHTNTVQAAALSDDEPLPVASGLTHVYDGPIKGYAGKFSNATVAQIRTMAEVDYVEHDQMVYATDVEHGAPWGLARISHRKKLGFGTFREYIYSSEGGKGVDAYVIDTGVNINHLEFQGRAKWGKTIPLNDVDEDANGHGTHCAGTIASRKYGVAKAANIIAVKVLGSNGSGTMSDVLAGVQWAANSAKAALAASQAELAATGKTAHKGSVANMSLGGGKSKALDATVNGAVDAGLHFAVAAGNENKDACNTSPAGAEKAITVGASTLADSRAYFSNTGPCVDVFAPGLNILSTWNSGNTSTNTISGTSMASPHVAGLLAYLLSIYPSVTFDPEIQSTEAVSSISATITATVYTAIHANLPIWVASFLPKPQQAQAVFGSSVAPIPSALTPAQLKAAILQLSSPDLLTDIPSNTINLLVFNNATALK